MTVYIEYLFLENFITGLLLLYFTLRLMEGPGDAPPCWWRIGTAGILCGGSGFCLFFSLNTAAGLLLRIAAGFLICLTAFGRQHIFKKTCFFLTISFLSGGTAMALFLWMQIPALSGYGALYLESMTWIRLFLCGIPAMVLTAWFIKKIKRKRQLDFALGMAEVELEGRRYSLKAYVDSGNCLSEPISRRPVILIDQKGAGVLPFAKDTCPERFTVVPYQAVGIESGLLEGIRLDCIRFGNRTLENVIMAYYDGNFDGFEILLHRDIIEGGMLEDGEGIV